ncbi:MAG: cytochrome c oxidase assembly protein, partial [Candidatus Binatia bacterium]
ALLALSPRALYAHAGHGPAALDEQHLGGAIMLGVGGVSYLAGGLWLSMRLLGLRGSARQEEPA